MRRSMPRLSEIARHVVVPAGVASTGWPGVEAKCRDFGVTFQGWQSGAGQIILAKRADGKYASTIGGTGLSIPRQVGKTFLLGAIVFALCLLRPGLTVIWTAHRVRTAEEAFGKMQAFAKRARIAPYVEKIVLGSGEEEIRFANRSRILFGARANGFGRGFDEVDVLIFDEAQILTDAALDDMIPATNQSRQPEGALLLFAGTPPRPIDPGEVFTRMRSEALSGEDEDTGWVEFGSDPGFSPTPPPARLTEVDWEQVAKANPSFPGSTPREAILRMRKKLGPDSFVREGLGIWDEVEARPGVFGRGAWEACASPFDPDIPLGAVGVAATPDLTFASIVGAGATGERVQVRPLDRDAGLGWCVTRCKELQDSTGCDVVVDAGGPASALVPLLEQAGVRASTPKAAEFFHANSTTLDMIADRRLEHDSYPLLDKQIEKGHRRTGDRFALERRKSPIDMVEAMVLATWGVSRPHEPAPVSVYEARGVMTI